VRSPRTISVTRYVTPLREGGSLPAIVEADDDGMYVLKFRGAGQGPRALILDSEGLNLALDYLPGSVTYDPLVDKLDSELASRIVWFDALVSNVDRTARNTNMLMWHRRLWLIDHGATLYFHHSPDWQENVPRRRDPFAMIKHHVLLGKARDLESIDESLAALLSDDVLDTIVSWIPDGWLSAANPTRDAQDERAAYIRYLRVRLALPRTYVEEAIRVR
jgi:hypothetical protein